ncbi:hypothetical protein Hanom_Chr07g00612781 [Helianthus anomalus]
MKQTKVHVNQPKITHETSELPAFEKLQFQNLDIEFLDLLNDPLDHASYSRLPAQN